jgi:ABC-type multidrug transport system fused ATPase/permease subunit
MNFLKLYKELLQILSTDDRRRLFIFCCLIVTSTLAEMVAIFIIPLFLSILFGGDSPNGTVYSLYEMFFGGLELWAIFSLTLGAILFSSVVRIIALRYTSAVGAKIGATLATKAFERSLIQDYIYYKSRNSSDVTSIVANKLNDVLFQAIIPGLQMLSAFVLTLGITILLISVAPVLTISALIFFSILYFTVSKLNTDQLKINSEKIALNQEKIMGLMQESYQGIRDIIFSARHRSVTVKFDEYSRLLRSAQGSNIFISLYPKVIIESFAFIFICCIAYYFNSSDNISKIMTDLAIFTIAAQRLLPCFQQIYASWASIKGSTDSSMDVINFFKTTISRRPHIESRNPIIFKSSIIINDLTFIYPNSSTVLLSNLNTEIKKGDWIGIVGPSGVGKSTLIDTITGLLVASSGRIVVDQVKLDFSNYHLWRENIGYVPQKIFISDDSLANNITLNEENSVFDDELLLKCLITVDLLSLSESLSDSPCAKLGENGSRLSGGQIQRVGIARALYQSKSLIILDEATGGLDVESERLIFNNIKNNFTHLTLLLIAHRKSTLKYCNKIISLNKFIDPIVYDLQQNSEFPIDLNSQLS